MTVVELKTVTTRELFELFAATVRELKDRGITRSTNNPIADYAELLFKVALNLELNENSTKGHDAVDTQGIRYEIKCRRVTPHNHSRQLSILRGLEDKHFDFLGAVLFKEDFSVLRACLIPHHQVLALSRFNPHTNGWIFHLRDAVWTLPGVTDVTKQLQAAESVHVASR